MARTILRSGACVACALLALTGGARADDVAQNDAVKDYAIGAAALDTVLREFALANGVLLSADGALTAGLASPGLRGRYQVLQGLHQLLAGTGLVAQRLPDGSYVLLRAPRAAAVPRPVQTLRRVDVQAVRDTGYVDGASLNAGKLDVSAWDSPQAITVVNRRQLRDQSVRSMADLLQYVPGIEPAQGEGNRDTAVFRGYSSNADFYIDGIRDDAQYFRDFYNVERVEALKGPNAAVFGRGGAGGIVNRVTKQASWTPVAQLSASVGSWASRRVEADVGQPLSKDVAVRVNAMEERGDSYRDNVQLRRHGINPVAAVRVGSATLVTVNGEYFRDDRTTDRGVPSYGSRPVATGTSTYFGAAGRSPNWVAIRSAGVGIEHETAGGATLSLRLHGADYDKYYQNVFAGGVEAGGDTVRMLAYGSATDRRNLFVQGDATWSVRSGAGEHRLAAGIELARQVTDNARTTGYFDTLGAGTRFVYVPVAHPVVDVPVAFRPSATDIDNHGTARAAALFLQDRWLSGGRWEAFLGLRADLFKVDFADRRTGAQFATHDSPLSPRIGVVYHATDALSLYASSSVAFVPRAGDQLASLTLANQALRPERMHNTEIGMKWLPRPELAATVAVYELRRRNVAVADPDDASSSLLVDGQRSRGIEASLTGRLAPGWNVALAYAWQLPRVTATQSAAAQAGATMPFVPRHSLSLWARHDWSDRFGAALGWIGRSSSFASTSNLVTVPGYARLDGALFYRASDRISVQLNAENLLGRRYYVSAFSDNNIMPGSPRAVRATVDLRF